MPHDKPNANFMSGKRGIILMIIIIIVSIYGSYNGLLDLINRNDQQWSDEDRRLLIEKCVKESGATGIKLELAKDYCECSTDKILLKFDKSEYVKLLEKPSEEKIKASLPVIQPCLTSYQNSLKLVE